MKIGSLVGAFVALGALVLVVPGQVRAQTQGNNTAQVQRDINRATKTLDDMQKLTKKINSEHETAVVQHNRAVRRQNALTAAKRAARRAANLQRSAARRRRNP